MGPKAGERERYPCLPLQARLLGRGEVRTPPHRCHCPPSPSPAASSLHVLQLLLQPCSLLLLLQEAPFDGPQLLLHLAFDVVGHHHGGLQVGLEAAPLLRVLLRGGGREGGSGLASLCGMKTTNRTQDVLGLRPQRRPKISVAKRDA